MRRLSMMIAAALVLGLLAACGGGGGSKTATTSFTTSAATTSDATAVASQTTEASPSAASNSGTPVMEASPSAEVSGDQPSGSFAYGFNVYFRGDDQGADFNMRTINAVKGAGFNWVRVQIPWDQFERANGQWDPLPIDRMVEQYQAGNVKILASVVKPPAWALDPSGNQL